MRLTTVMAATAALLLAGSATAQMKTSTAAPQPTTTSYTVPMASPSTTTTANAAPSTDPLPPLESARRITREEAAKLIKSKKAIYVDVRGKEAYDQSHIKGAINVPLSDIETDYAGAMKKIPAKKFIITYCA